MNSITQTEENILKQKMLMLDHNNLIQSAIEKKISWNTLARSLTDLVTSVDRSKELILALVK